MGTSSFLEFGSDYIFLFLILTLGVMGVAVAISMARRQALLRAWQELAERNGLTFDRGSWLRMPSVLGVYRGRSVLLDTFTRGYGRNRTTFTRVRLPLKSPSGLTLEISEENLFTRIGKTFGMKEIETGDQELDARFVIKGQPENDILRLLMQGNLRQKLLETPALNIKLKDSALVYERRGQQMDGEYLQVLFSLLSDLADRVEGISGGAV
jgi:hypothetical protein